MHPEALILRRCYPVPVTFADLRAAYDLVCERTEGNEEELRGCLDAWCQSLKEITGAIDEVYAVVDGREVRVATTSQGTWLWLSQEVSIGAEMWDLLEHADRNCYWEHPHEVRLDLSPRPVSHGEVARAVLVGQEALERGGVVRS